MCYRGQLSAKIKELTRSDWPVMQMNYQANDWKYIKKTFPPKTGIWKKQVLQHLGYIRGVKTACCMLHGILHGCKNII